MTFSLGPPAFIPPRGTPPDVVGSNAQNMDFVMSAPLKTVERSDIATLMHEIGGQAKSAARTLALADRAHKSDILAANAQDMAEAKASGAAAAFLDRLALDDKRIAGMAEGL